MCYNEKRNEKVSVSRRSIHGCICSFLKRGDFRGGKDKQGKKVFVAYFHKNAVWTERGDRKRPIEIFYEKIDKIRKFFRREYLLFDGNGVKLN